MANVLLTTTADSGLDFWTDDCARIRRAAAKDSFRVHSVVDDPAAADVILFFEPVDPCLAANIRRHPYAKRYPEKVFVFDTGDRILPFFPGLYPSITKRHYDRSRVRPGFYPMVFDQDWVAYDAEARPPDLLFSFFGSIGGIPVREAIAKIRHPRGLVRDTACDPGDLAEQPEEVYVRYRCQFADAMARSAFTLCPKGEGASTIRVFETMKAGRVPVIIADEWVGAEGPTWDAFSVRVRERDVERLPGILQGHETAASAMGKLAREQWEQWFAESVAFHRIVEWCLDIMRSRRLPEATMSKLVFWQLFEPHNFRRKLMPAIRRWHMTV